ncbi:hypothetical protein [Cohnella silvisoli]
MNPIQARFATQDQAESAMRKLAALRSDRFRLERVATSLDIDTSIEAAEDMSPLAASADAAAHQWGVSPEGSSSAVFTLSANVPDAATDQARTVILQAGGQII